MKHFISKAAQLFSKPAIVPKRFFMQPAMRCFTTENNGIKNKNIFTSPTTKEEREEMDRQSANQMFQELKDEEVNLDDREAATKNLSLNLLQTETPE